MTLNSLSPRHVVGVTGNRKIHASLIGPLERILRSLMEGLAARGPLEVLTPLAIGADTLVARAALAVCAPINAPLPFPVAMYRLGYAESDRPEFDRLLGQATSTVIMPLVGGAEWSDVAQKGPARNQQYAMVGAYVAQHSELLVTITDRHEPMRPGGSLDVIRMVREGIPAALRVSTAPAGWPRAMLHLWIDSDESGVNQQPQAAELEPAPFGWSKHLPLEGDWGSLIARELGW